jgi:hypothetical protein
MPTQDPADEGPSPRPSPNTPPDPSDPLPLAIQDENQNYDTAALAERTLARLRAGQIRHAQEQKLRTVRPMALHNGEAAKIRAEVKRDHKTSFVYAEPEQPQGDEKSLHRAHDRLGINVISILDENGEPKKVRITPQEYDAWLCQQTFHQAFENETLTFDDLLPYRIRTAYRLVRELGRIRGLIKKDETLIDALKGRPWNFDPWLIPQEWHRPTNPDENDNLPGEIIDKILQAENLSPDLQYTRWDLSNNTLKHYRGLALLPPPVPQRYLTPTGEISESYDPEQDESLLAYIDILDAVSRRLYVIAGAEEEPESGRYGMAGMLDPHFVRAVFPTRLQIIAWEQLLIEETLNLLVTSSHINARRVLTRKYGLQRHEIDFMVRLANLLALKMTECDLEEARSLMILRIEDYIHRSREAIDPRSEMHGLKQLAIVQGLSQEKEDDFFANVASIVKNISDQNRERRKELPQPERQFIDTTARALSA